MKNIKINVYIPNMHLAHRHTDTTHTHTNTHAHTTLRGCLRVAADPTSQELQRTILSLAFLQLCLPRCGTVARCVFVFFLCRGFALFVRKTQGIQEPIPETQLSKGRKRGAIDAVTCARKFCGRTSMLKMCPLNGSERFSQPFSA